LLLEFLRKNTKNSNLVNKINGIALIDSVHSIFENDNNFKDNEKIINLLKYFSKNWITCDKKLDTYIDDGNGVLNLSSGKILIL
jgi:hypothetical protein